MFKLVEFFCLLLCNVLIFTIMPMHLGSFKKTKTTSTSTKTHFLNLSCKTLHHFEGPNTKLAKIGFNLTSGFRANFFFFFFF